MAVTDPDLFDQIWYEREIAESKTSDEPGAPSWKLPGETAQQARDRLRAEREAAKAAAAGEAGRTIAA